MTDQQKLTYLYRYCDFKYINNFIDVLLKFVKIADKNNMDQLDINTLKDSMTLKELDIIKDFYFHITKTRRLNHIKIFLDEINFYLEHRNEEDL